MDRAIEAVRMRYGYGRVHDVSTGSVVSADPDLDITRLVLRRLRSGDDSPPDPRTIERDGPAHPPPPEAGLAYVDRLRLIENTPGAAEAEATFEREMESYRAELRSLTAELEADQDAYAEQHDRLTAAARSRRQQELTRRREEIERRRTELEARAAERQQQLIAPIVESAQAATDSVRESEGYALVLTATSSGEAVADRGPDITEAVIHRMRQQAAGVEETVTIPRTTFDDNPVENLPPPPDAGGVRDRPSRVSLDREPRPLNTGEISRLLQRDYPPMLKKAGIDGRVVMKLFVDENGEVQKTQVQESSGYEAFDEVAADVAARMRFEPAIAGGEPIGVWTALPLQVGMTAPPRRAAEETRRRAVSAERSPAASYSNRRTSGVGCEDGPLDAGEMLGAIAGVLGGKNTESAMRDARRCGEEPGGGMEELTRTLQGVTEELEEENRRQEAELQARLRAYRREARRREEAERRARERAAAERRRRQQAAAGGDMPTSSGRTGVEPSPEERRRAEREEQQHREEEAARRQQEEEQRRQAEEERRRQREEARRRAEEERRASYPPACRNIETQQPGIEGDFAWLLERCLSYHVMLENTRTISVTVHDACEATGANRAEFRFRLEGRTLQGNVYTGAWPGRPLHWGGNGVYGGESPSHTYSRTFWHANRSPMTFEFSYDTRRYPGGVMDWYWKITYADGRYEYQTVSVPLSRSGAYDFRGNYTGNVPSCR